MEPSAPPNAPFSLTPEMVAAGERLVGTPLCSECLGRVFGRSGHGLTNPERASLLQGTVSALVPATPESCFVCAGAFNRWPTWTRRAREAIEGLDGERVTCGSRWDPELLAREEAIWGVAGSSWGETARAAFNREWGKHITADTGRVSLPGPAELTLIADLPLGRVEVSIASVYVQGRYRKLDRTIPQTHWPCRRCRGRGCDSCGGTGAMYPTSVEQLVGAPFLVATQAVGTRFHGMGREDIDARMLGTGRPFVLELLSPRRRRMDLPALSEEIRRTAEGRVEVQDLAPASSADVRTMKESAPPKSYRVTVRGEAPTESVKEALELVPHRAIAQRTPTRVAHRRADRVRTRRIVEVALVQAEAGRFTLDLKAEAGTYVKEWVEGDAGRTEPSLAQLLGVPLKVEELDVLQVYDGEVR